MQRLWIILLIWTLTLGSAFPGGAHAHAASSHPCHSHLSHEHGAAVSRDCGEPQDDCAKSCLMRSCTASVLPETLTVLPLPHGVRQAWKSKDMGSTLWPMAVELRPPIG